MAERIELDYDLLAAKIVAQLEPQSRRAGGLVSAKEIGSAIGRSPRWVREHKTELGGAPMSDGPRPRLGFDPAKVDRALAARRFDDL